MPKLRRHLFRLITAGVTLGTVGILLLLVATPVQALVVSQSGNVQVTATVGGPPPTTQAVIVSPTTGSQLTTTPLVVRGTCQADLVVRVFNNGQLAGTITCASDGQFVVNITLQVGTNVLTALNYDFLDQAGPNSPSVTVTVPEPAIAPVDTPATVDQSVPGVVGDSLVSSDSSHDRQRLFEGTVIEPVAHFLDFGVVVSPTVNSTISVATNGVFVVGVLALFILILL